MTLGRPLRLLLACLTIGALAALPRPASATDGGADGPYLSRAQHGAAALRGLGDRLPEVAARNRLSAAALRDLLREDHTAFVSPEGRLFYAEDAPAETTTTAASTTAVAPAYPTTRTFTLHSRPGSAHTIFLDFDGATVSGTAWNGTGSGDIPDGSHIGYDVDGSPSTFSAGEHGFVQEVWRQVAETYAPFDVDVTTEDPGADAWTRTSSGDLTYGTHVVVTSSTAPQQQVCGGCLGVAWIGTFDAVDSAARYQPAWVFAYDKAFDPMVVAQAASHETGHTLGLAHDGTATASYFSGTSTWGPVMGSARRRAISQWSRGEYAGASNTEDDVAVIQANGLPLRPDDHGDTADAADRLGALSSYGAAGVIGTRADADVFAVDLPCTTDLSVAATGIGAQTALDLSLTVLDAGGTVVASASPASGSTGSPPVSAGMDAGVTVPGASGTFYLRVDGVGNGDPAGSGWSDYGSLGQYHLQATGCPDAPPGTGVTSGSTPPTTTTTPTGSGTTSARVPVAPGIRLASSGTRGGVVTAVARWAAPRSNGGATVTGYRVRSLRLDSHGRVLRAYVTGWLRPTTRAVALRLPRGRYAFTVAARNRVGGSAWSRTSRVVTAR